ncbi:methylated-DNA--[protein]-cysteine S-methyltransferase [Magnetovibrio sp.]|uniref:methylated-DNA--[protein]-cysteine S-methyltransferase n=1 Tax=Magnetovibrio sp. TaxID=2024836 RepID=UPI002F948EFC
METLCIKTPVGELTLFEDGGQIVALDWGQGLDTPRTSKNPVLSQAAEALRDYFRSGDENFKTLPLDPGGTEFQRRVWKEMQKIKPGKVKTYGEIAKSLNSSPRAVGNACGANPIPILIPCHRVVGQSTLGGYTGDGGLDTKTQLLRLEGYL